MNAGLHPAVAVSRPDSPHAKRYPTVIEVLIPTEILLFIFSGYQSDSVRTIGPHNMDWAYPFTVHITNSGINPDDEPNKMLEVPVTNNPRKIVGLQGYNLEVVERLKMPSAINVFNCKYLETKRDKMNHMID